VVVDEIDLGKADQVGLAGYSLKFGFDRATDDLFRRYTICFLHPGTHELYTPRESYIRFEAVGAQVSEEFDHRL
jgi:hypothetical protein